MKRSELIKKLVSEGLSEKTLANFSDKQIVEVSKRILGEAVTKQVRVLSMKNPNDAAEVNTLINDPKKVADMKARGHIEVTTEGKPSPSKKKLSKKQSNKMDTDKDGDIDAKDLKNLRSKKQKSKVCSKCGMKNCKCKDKKHSNLKENSSELKEWIKSLVENNYHSFTSKKEIMGLINEKMENNVPEFLTFDSIVKAGNPQREPEETPVETPVNPDVDPGEPLIDPTDPFRRDRPVEKPGPKAGIKKFKNVSK